MDVRVPCIELIDAAHIWVHVGDLHAAVIGLDNIVRHT